MSLKKSPNILKTLFKYVLLVLIILAVFYALYHITCNFTNIDIENKLNLSDLINVVVIGVATILFTYLIQNENEIKALKRSLLIEKINTFESSLFQLIYKSQSFTESSLANELFGLSSKLELIKLYVNKLDNKQTSSSYDELYESFSKAAKQIRFSIAKGTVDYSIIDLEMEQVVEKTIELLFTIFRM